MKIITDYICPPIPYRGNDWIAYFEEEGEEAQNYGYGSTQQEAIRDLLLNGAIQ